MEAHAAAIHGPGERARAGDWIKRGLSGRGAVWLHVGWYDHDASDDEYRRLYGHWVTLVGHGVREDGTPDASVLILHDPSPRAGVEPSNEFVLVEPIASGRLRGRNRGLPRAAKGYLKMTGGMHVRADADVGILDGVVVLELDPAESMFSPTDGT